MVGGVLNSTLRTWLQDLTVYNFDHVTVEAQSISPLDQLTAAEKLKNEIQNYTPDRIISVGKFADKLLRIVHVEHGSLPNVQADKREVAKQIAECKHYLLGGLYVINGPRVG